MAQLPDLGTINKNQEAMKAAGAAILLPKESAVENLYEAILQAIETRMTGKREKKGQGPPRPTKLIPHV